MQEFVNEHFEASMGRSRSDLIDKRPADIFNASRASRTVAMDNKVISEGHMERVVPCDQSGRLQMHEEHRFAVHDTEGNPTGLGCFAFEITGKSITEEALAQAQRLAEIGSWRWSIRDNCLISCSEQFAKILDIEVVEAFDLMQDWLGRFIHPKDIDEVRALHNNLSDPNLGGYEITYRIILANGQERYVREIAEPVIGPNGQPIEYAGTLQNVTDQKRAERELLRTKQSLERRVERRTADLEYLATRDPLTGLMNRTFFREEIACDFSANGHSEIAVILLDLDGFKDINDTYGHSVGDSLYQGSNFVTLVGYPNCR